MRVRLSKADDMNPSSSSDELRRNQTSLSEGTNFLHLLPVSVCARPCFKVVYASLSNTSICKRKQIKMLPEKFFSKAESFRTHQKTDKTGPETHQRTVVPERDKRGRVSQPATGEDILHTHTHIPS